MISLMQATGGITNIISNLIELIRYYMRGAIAQVRAIINFLLTGTVEPETPQTPEIETIDVITEVEQTALITPFRLAVAVLVAVIVIFAVIIMYQGHVEKETKKEAFEQGTFSHAESRGADEKTAENEHKDESEARE